MNDPISNTGNNISKRTFSCASRHAELHIFLYSQKVDRFRPVLLVDVPRDSNITAKVMKSLNIPKGVRRVLFRTSNTDRRLMFKKEFDSSFVGFKADGAKWLVENTDIKLVGLDYLSVAAYTDARPTHLIFLKNREIILVEGLKLGGVKTGVYDLHCLPLRLRGVEGSPARCILIK
ncbi:Cyclase-like protein 2 [Turnera subulata]|uniref:Cyclase-like protein 2 n=1 Tax=Turnera subulata TaxID=218843 RepID=A0A9Q0FGA5_9ROSI|nr:Cyclase-like protein 2 [Turnera subulata]